MEEIERQKKVEEAMNKMDAIVSSILSNAHQVADARGTLMSAKATYKTVKDVEMKRKTNSVKALASIDSIMGTRHVGSYLRQIGDAAAYKKWLVENPRPVEAATKDAEVPAGEPVKAENEPTAEQVEATENEAEAEDEQK